jgi:hypothetical protein
MAGTCGASATVKIESGAYVGRTCARVASAVFLFAEASPTAVAPAEAKVAPRGPPAPRQPHGFLKVRSAASPWKGENAYAKPDRFAILGRPPDFSAYRLA